MKQYYKCIEDGFETYIIGDYSINGTTGEFKIKFINFDHQFTAAKITIFADSFHLIGGNPDLFLALSEIGEKLTSKQLGSVLKDLGFTEII